MKDAFLVTILIGFCTLIPGQAIGQTAPINCLPAESALAYWRPIRSTMAQSTESENALVSELVSCLGSPNSELRDGIAYELFTYWLRNDVLSQQTRIELLNTLTTNLANRNQEAVLSRSYSALILGELMRADNLSSFMTADQRSALLEQATQALALENDFRGLEPDIGWVHPVAHMADLLWRFTLHQSFDARQARLVLEGIRNKARPNAAAYIFNEGDRLARPVAYLVARGILPASDIVHWLEGFETTLNGESWFDAFQSIEGLRELHNSKGFIRALSNQLEGEELDEVIQIKLDALVQMFAAIV